MPKIEHSRTLPVPQPSAPRQLHEAFAPHTAGSFSHVPTRVIVDTLQYKPASQPRATLHWSPSFFFTVAGHEYTARSTRAAQLPFAEHFVASASPMHEQLEESVPHALGNASHLPSTASVATKQTSPGAQLV